jgi:lipid II:glycine glycyltransferase (peptidoglycan interpeptide bridge formation enzyme)
LGGFAPRFSRQNFFAVVERRLGDIPFYLQLNDGDGAVGCCLVIHVKARRGDFLYVPYGPFLKDPKYFPSFVTVLKELAAQQRVAFVRVSSYLADAPHHAVLFDEAGFKPAPLHMLAEHLWLLDIEGKSEEDILAGMEKQHRYLVRRAEKDGVTVRSSTDSADLQIFMDLHNETVRRHSFTPYPEGYFQSQLELFGADDQIRIFIAEFEGKPMAAGVIMYYEGVASYHHGASTSDPAYRKIPASYLLQWEAIREALRRKCHTYNFWGIAPEGDKKHPFYGITHFKKGFGGRLHQLLHCRDLPITGRYTLVYLLEKWRKWRRGF